MKAPRVLMPRWRCQLHNIKLLIAIAFIHTLIIRSYHDEHFSFCCMWETRIVGNDRMIDKQSVISELAVSPLILISTMSHSNLICRATLEAKSNTSINWRQVKCIYNDIFEVCLCSFHSLCTDGPETIRVSP